MSDDLGTPARRFTEKVALVTGAGNGIGRAVCRRLAAEGATVVGIEIDEDALRAVEADIRDAGGSFEGLVADIGSRDACVEVVEHCVRAHGRLDVLGNVAGIARAEHFTDVSEDLYRRLMAVNADGPFFLSQAAMPHLLASKGSLVNVASNSAVQGVAYLVAYSMTKAAIVALTRSLAMEYAKSDVRVNAIAPGGTATRLTETFVRPADMDIDLAMRSAGFRGVNDPDEVAALFAFVASDEAPGIHGAVLSIDRGLTSG
jgi:meso-butanediol dehydrogenase / (S,S)-butanediol dehydrogenase / diacetyl reductase